MFLAITAFLGAGHAFAATATRPVQVKSTSYLYSTDVASVVVTDGPAVITLTNLAYRHPEEVQARIVVGAAGTYTIKDFCKPYLLPHTWIVYVDGVALASASHRCR